MARRPGVSGGRLQPCPRSPNCVSSQARDPGQRVDPLAVPGDPERALDRLRAVVESLPRTRVVSERDGYLHAEFRSRLFGFVDDVEFLHDPEAGAVHVRSASRVGYSDLGANRRRVEQIRRALARTADRAGP